MPPSLVPGRRGRAGALALLAGLAFCAAPAAAEVIAAQPSGFEVREHAQIAAPPDRVWAALAKVGSWWSPTHTYSHDAANLSLTPEAGGCFCERWAAGSVRHMTVIAAEPARLLRLEGALGPLGQMGVTGHLTFTLTPDAQGTSLDVVYDVGGWAKGGLEALAAPVDQVLGEQVQRLARVAAGGTP